MVPLGAIGLAVCFVVFTSSTTLPEMASTGRISARFSNALIREGRRNFVPRAIKVRNGNPDDLSSIQASLRNFSLGTGWSQSELARELATENTFVLVAEEADDVHVECHIVGLIVFWHIVDQVEIGNLFVSPDCRRRGVAKQLIASAIDTGRRLDSTMITLEVRESNQAARSLYSNLGFEEVGRRPKYYAGVEDAVMMNFLLERSNS